MNKKRLVYKLKEFTGKKIIAFFGLCIDAFQGEIIFTDPHLIKGVKELENSWQIILEEYKALCLKRDIPGIDEFFEEQKVLAANRSWRSFPLLIYGYELVENTNDCPETTRLLQNIEGISAAMFSVISPQKEIPPHNGPYKGMLRIHLGLIVPGDISTCFIEIKGKRSGWQAGRCIAFDDTHRHYAANHTEFDRVVLFIDVVRPLPFVLKQFNKLLFHALAKSEFIQEAISQYKPFGNETIRRIPTRF
jgi:aspartyl/asparaginyl beta-hydroxylase (cupin superfamily)